MKTKHTWIAAVALAVIAAWTFFLARGSQEQRDLAAVRRGLPDFAPHLSLWDSWLLRHSTWFNRAGKTSRFTLPDWMTRRAIKREMDLTMKESAFPFTCARLGTNVQAIAPNLVRLLNTKSSWKALEVLVTNRGETCPGMGELLRRNATPQWSNMWAMIILGIPAHFNGRHDRYLSFALYGMSSASTTADVSLCSGLIKERKHRLEAIRCLGNMGERGRKAGEVLRQVIRDAGEWQVEPAERAAALVALANIEGREATPTLLECLNSSSSDLRVTAAGHLWTWNYPATNLLNTLDELLKSKRASIRVRTLELLGRMGESARPLADRIADRTSDEDERVRRAAAVAVKNLRM